MKSIINFFTFLIFGLSGVSFAQETGFEGVFEFTKKTGTAEVKYKYYVKGDKIRIEDYGTDGTLQGVMLVDTKANKVLGLSPDRKLYMEMPNNRVRKEVSVEISKTGNTKKIAGYDCTEWKVSSTEEDRVISYWMASDNFNFFIPMLKTLNRADKLSIYFLRLTGAEGMFPMMGEEKRADGTLITTLKVSSVKKQTVESSKFEIPSGYSKYDK